MTDLKRRRPPRSVPVASREAERRERKAAKARAKTRPGFRQRDLASTGILIVVILLVLAAIAVPLRNYYEGRGEIARAQASIAALEAEKQQLETDIEHYQDNDFVEQEARRRLGVLAEGETAWRIVDPRMSGRESITSDAAEVTDNRVWPEVLWDSLREDPESDGVSDPEPSEGEPAGGGADNAGVPGAPAQPAP